jgi:hypothetical protein
MRFTFVPLPPLRLRALLPLLPPPLLQAAMLSLSPSRRACARSPCA